MKQYEAPTAEPLFLIAEDECLSTLLSTSDEPGGGLIPPEDEGWTEPIK